MDEQGGFFPPDAAEGGVDLDALLVVRARDLSSMASAADQLARSGAFGLLVVDLMGVPSVEPAGAGSQGNPSSRGWGWRRRASFGGDR